YVLVCFSDECSWTIKASCRKKSDVFKVRYFKSEHTCPMRDRVLTKVQAIVGFVSGVTAPKLVNHKRIHTSKDIIADIREFYGVQISYQQAWRAKERTLEMIRGCRRLRKMTSNIAECINGCLVEARQLSILEFLEEVRILFGSWHCKNREIASYTKDTLGRRFEEVLIINVSKSLKMEVVPSSEFIFSVYEAGRRYIVCLERKVCSCGRFQLDEKP
ncbi:hypothetical protein H5410_006463, partial [Solanum commersonii]